MQKRPGNLPRSVHRDAIPLLDGQGMSGRFQFHQGTQVAGLRMNLGFEPECVRVNRKGSTSLGRDSPHVGHPHQDMEQAGELRAWHEQQQELSIFLLHSPSPPRTLDS
jgi:hypothetical protein